MRTATGAAIVGALFDAYIILRDDLPLWLNMPALNPVLAAARACGAVTGGAVLFALAEYGVYRQKAGKSDDEYGCLCTIALPASVSTTSPRSRITYSCRSTQPNPFRA